MYVIRVALDPDAESGTGDLHRGLHARLEGPLTSIEGIDGIEGVYVAPDGRSAFVPLVLTADLDVPAADIGSSLRDITVHVLGVAPAHVEVYMAAPTPGACPICNKVGAHDWRKHKASRNFAGGLIRL